MIGTKYVLMDKIANYPCYPFLPGALWICVLKKRNEKHYLKNIRFIPSCISTIFTKGDTFCDFNLHS